MTPNRIVINLSQNQGTGEKDVDPLKIRRRLRGKGILALLRSATKMTERGKQESQGSGDSNRIGEIQGEQNIIVDLRH